MKVLNTIRIEDEPLIDDPIHPIETFAKSTSATDFKGLELYT